MYIGDYLGRRALYTPDRLAILDAGRSPEWRLTYAELNRRTNRLAHWLRHQAGVGYGDRVAILARDRVEHLEAFFACGKLGAIHVPLNWRAHWRELLGMLAQVRPKVLIFEEEFRPAVTGIDASMAAEPAGITHGLHLDGAGLEWSRHYETQLQASPDSTIGYEKLEAEDIAALIFTGGTTGLPKAARISHRMIAWNSLNTLIHDVIPGDLYLNVFPLFHTGGLFVYTLPQVILGGTSILLRHFDPSRVLELIEGERVSLFAGVPTMYRLLTQSPRWPQADLSSLRFCTSGGAPLPVPLVEQYAREKGVRFKQGFGMTEFGPGVFALAPEDAVSKAGSIGRPNFFVEARVLDPQGRALGPGEPGELVLRGPSLSSGYFGQPGMEGPALDPEGFFHTGDVAKYDADGYFFILDRLKDMYLSGGENVYPVEIEQALYQHPGVQHCAVIGVPDPKWGEVGLACVVPAPGQSLDEVELLVFLRDRLAGYKVPTRVEFLEQLPLSAAGKILKSVLRARMIGLGSRSE